MADPIWNGSDDDWMTPGDWSGGVVPAAGDAATVDSGNADITTDEGTVGSVAIGAGGTITFDDGALSTTGDLVNAGGVLVDPYFGTAQGVGGSVLSVGGTLDNSQTFDIGNASIANASLVIAKAVTNESGADLSVVGSATVQASLDIASAAGFGTATALDGTVSLSGDALIDFEGGGAIETIDQGASLQIDGTAAFVASGTDTTSNSALSGLGSVAGELELSNGASAAVDGSLSNSGTIILTGYGGGPASALDIASAAGFGTAGTLDGTVALSGNALIDFEGGGSIATIDQGASLQLDGTAAFLASGSDTSSNNALSGLGSVAGELDLSDGASVDVGGNLSNSGTIMLSGGGGSTSTLDVDADAGFGTPGAVSGTVSLSGQSVISFTLGGEITAIASGATLSLGGTAAFVADASDLTSNSALTGLASNAGTLSLSGGASISTTGDFENDGALNVDAFTSGNSSFDVGGTLTNTSFVTVGDFYAGEDPTLSLGALDNTVNGNVDIYGSSTIIPELTVAGTTTNDGSILDEGGGVVFSGSVTGTGTIYLGSESDGGGARVEIGSASSNAINFEGGATDTLVLDDPAGFTGQLQELGIGETIDLVGVDATAATISANDATLTVDETSGAALTYALSTDPGYGLPGNTTFATQSDGNGGTDLVLVAGAPPSITAPASEAVTEGTTTTLTGFSVADPDPKAGTITVGLYSTTGELTAARAGAGTVYEGGQAVILSGTLADVNAELASVAYIAPLRTTAATSASDSLYMTLSDQDGQQVDQSIPVTIGVGPVVVTAPATSTVQEGVASSLGALSLADSTTATGGFSVVLTSQSGALSATQAGAATVVGVASDQLTLSGTLADVNAELASVSYVGAPPSGTADTAADAVTVLATDPNGFRDQQVVGVTVDTAPYDHFLGAASTLASDITAYAPQTQIAADAVNVEAAAVSGAIGTLAGTADQAAFDASAAILPDVGVSPAGSPASQADVEGLYDSLLAGAVGTIATAGDVPRTFSLQPILTYITDAANNQQDLGSYAELLNLDIQNYYEDLSASTTAVSAPYQAAYQASLAAGQTFVTDSQVSATPAQLLADISNLYDGMIDGGLGSTVPPATLSAIDTSLVSLTADVGDNAGQAALVNDVTGVYVPLVRTAASAASPQSTAGVASTNVPSATASSASAGALQTYDAAIGATNSFSTIATSGDSAEIAQANLRLYTQALPAIVGLGSSSNPAVNLLLSTTSTLNNQIAAKDYAAAAQTATTFMTQSLGAGSATTLEQVMPMLAGLVSPASPADLLSQSGQVTAFLATIAEDQSTAAHDGIIQSLQSLLSDLNGQSSSPVSPQTAQQSPTQSGSGATADGAQSAAQSSGTTSSDSEQLTPDQLEALLNQVEGNGGDINNPLNPTLGIDSTTDKLFQSIVDLESTFTVSLIAVPVVDSTLAAGLAAGLASGAFSTETVVLSALFGVAFVEAIPAILLITALAAFTAATIDFYAAHSKTLDGPGGSDGSVNAAGKLIAGAAAAAGAGLHGLARALGLADVHLTTFTNQYYNFQAEGEFVLTRSTNPSNSFQIQARLQPWFNSSAVTVTTELAAEVGTDRVTFDINRPNLVWVNGQATALSPTNSILNLAGGQIVELTPTSFQLTWKTGESMTVTNAGSYLNYSIGLGPSDGPGSVQGLFGTDESQANDFTLPDGTILPQNLTSTQLYGTFANAWRVSDATSLLDYGTNPDGSTQTTADFTDTSFPTSTISLAQLPANIVANAALLAAAAGITDPNLAAGAELDYIATGDTSFFASAAYAQQLGTTTTAAPITPSAAPTPEIGISALQTSVTPAAGQPVDVSFEVYLTGALTTDTTIDYALQSIAPGELGAAAFGGTAPSGQVTIAAGQTTGTFSIQLPANVLGQTPTASLAVGISSPDGLPVFAATTATTLVNPTPEPGPAAEPTISTLSDVGTLTGSGTAYTLALGTVVEGEAIPALKFAINNTADPTADQLAGTLGVSTTSAGFTAVGTGTLAPIAGGASYGQLYAVANTSAAGANIQTLTLIPEDVNASGYSATLPNITLTIADTVIAPAQAVLNTPQTVDFGAVRQGSTVSQAVSITNAAASGAAALDVTSTANGGALTAGASSGLAAGATDATDISIGIQTAVAGATSGVVTLGEQSDAEDGNTAPLGSTTIDVSGSVYREAQLSVAPASPIVHVGDPGTMALDVTNADPADGYSENLIATLTGTTGPVTVSGNTAGEIAAGATDTGITLGFSTAVAGTVQVGATFAVSTDGTGLDGFGPTSLGTQTVSAPIIVDNYAQAGLSETSGGGTWTQDGADYTLNLGDIAQNSGSLAIGLAVGNTAGGPADLLAGTFSTAGSSVFSTSGFGAVAGLGAGASATAGTVTLDTTNAGQFTETITLAATGSNASGYSGALTPQTLTIIGTVGGPPALPIITAPGAVTVTGATPTSLGTLSIADANVGAAPLSVSVSDLSGTLDAEQFGDGSVLGDGTAALTLTGSLAQINAALGTLSYTGLPVPGQAGTTIPDTLSIAVTDSVGQSASATVAITDGQAPETGPIVTAPTSIPTAVGVPTTLNGISVSDPYITSIGATDAVTIAFPDAVLNATGPGIATSAGGSGVVVTGQGTASLTLTGTPDALNQVLLSDVSGTLASDGSSGSVTVNPASGPYDFVDFAKTDNIQKALLAQFPTGIVVADNALETPFDITSDANGDTFNDAEGSSLTIPVDVPKANSGPGGGGVDEVDMLIGAYDAPVGADLETVEFDGIDGSNNAVSEIFTLVDGQTVRDVFQSADGDAATTLDPSAAAPQALNAFTFSDVTGGGTAAGGSTGNAKTGATGTYNIDEQRFVLDPDFQTASLQQIVITPSGAGGTPILLGVTVRETPAVLDAGESNNDYNDRVRKILNPDEPDPPEPPEPPVNPPDIPPSTGGGATGQGNGHNGKAQGDVHLTTYDGLYYNFQAEGEFVLTKSTVAGDPFQVQIRLEPWYTSASVSVITEAAVQVGTDRVTFDTTRPNLIDVDGVASTALTGPKTSLTLNGGTLSEIAAGQYEIVENTGETVTVTSGDGFLNVSPTLAPTAGAGSVEGLLGADSGQANDFQAANGTILQQPLTSTELYGTFANSWRVTQATSLLDYGPGQTTATFTDTTFPSDVVSLADLPADVVAKAAAIVAAAGITDPTIAAGAELDYIATGDLSFVSGAAAAQSTTPVSQAVISQTTAPPPSIGVSAAAVSVVAGTATATPVDFELYLTSAATTSTEIDYTAVLPNAADRGLSAFGGTLPSGHLVIAAGSTSAEVEIDVPVGALGALSNAPLELQVTSPSAIPVFAGSAITTLVSPTAPPSVTGIALTPSVADLGAGQSVDLTLTLDEPVAVTGTPTLALDDGGTATYAGSGSGFTQSLIFTTTVAAGQNAASLAATALQLSNGTIVNAAGTAVATSLAGLSQPGPTVDTVAPAVSSPTLTVAQNAAATPIGIAPPSDNLTAATTLDIVAGTLPDDGTVTLADGVTPVAAGESLTASQLAGLAFTPTPGAFSKSSTLTYTVTDGAGNAATGTATLDIGGPGAPTLSGTHASATTAESPVVPFAGVTLADPSQETDTLTIALANGGGTLSGTGLAADPDGTYTLAGSAAAVTQMLDALTFAPTAPAPGASATTYFVLTDASADGSTTLDSGTSVTDTAASPGAPSPSPPTGPSPSGPSPSSASQHGDTIAFDPDATFRRGVFALTGTASSPAGVQSVEITADVYGVATDLGAATVGPNGVFTFEDRVGSQTQSAITATETDGAGGMVQGVATYALKAGIRGRSYVAAEVDDTAGGAKATSTVFGSDGSSTVLIDEPGQTVTSSAFSIFENRHQANTTFVFDPGFGIDVVKGFTVGGPNHDVLALPSADFSSFADVLRNTGDIQGSAWITDPKTGDAIRLAGVTTAELKAHPKDITFHA